MTNLKPVQYISRGGKAAAMAALLFLGHSSFVSAAPAAIVIGIEPTRVADVILLRGGFDAGLRQGMVCRLARGDTVIAEVLVVELRPAHSAALILGAEPKQAIRAGDVASIKILKT